MHQCFFNAPIPTLLQAIKQEHLEGIPEIRSAIHGLPQGGVMANKLLRKRLTSEGFYEVPHTPGLWKHISRPIQFSLVVDDFGVKYVGKKHALFLLQVLHKYYKTSIDWTGSLYCGITLNWNYEEHWVDISMPGYIDKVRKRFQQELPTKLQHCPFQPQPKKMAMLLKIQYNQMRLHCFQMKAKQRYNKLLV